MTTVTRIRRFEAAHQLPAEFGGPAARLHGHSYTVRIEVERGYPTELLDQFWDNEAARFDHRLLNDVFEDTTVEGLAETFLDRLTRIGVPVLSVAVQEGEMRFARATA